MLDKARERVKWDYMALDQEDSMPTPKETQPIESSLMKEYDRILSEAEKVAQRLDQQLIEVVRNWEDWRKQFSWKEESEDGWPEGFNTGYRIQTTATDGTPRTLEVYTSGAVVEKDQNEKILGITNIINSRRNRLDDSVKPIVEPIVVTYTSGDNEGLYVNGRWQQAVLQQDGVNYERNKVSGMAGIETAYGWTGRSGFFSRERYVAPEKEDLPNPVDKAAEIVNMLRRGQVTHRNTSHRLNSQDWQEFSPEPQVNSAK